MSYFINTKKRGSVSFLTYKEKGEYVGVCVDFGITEYNKDINELETSIQEAALSYLKAVIKTNGSDELLNLKANKKSEKMISEIRFEKYIKNLKTKAVKPSTKYNILNFKISQEPYQGASFCF